MNPEELSSILEFHKRWLQQEEGGVRANLNGANLRSADLRYADLSSANLTGADLRYADLSSANLSSANLRYADLSSADLNGADLRYADLRYANLRSAGLRYADLSSADLDFSYFPLWCGSLGIKCDQRLFAQLAYHMCSMDVPEELQQYQEMLKPIAEKFHRFDDCGGFR